MTDSTDLARRLMAEAFAVEAGSIGPDTAIGTLDAWDSLAHMRLILALEDHLGEQLDADVVVEIESFSDVERVLATNGRGS